MADSCTPNIRSTPEAFTCFAVHHVQMLLAIILITYHYENHVKAASVPRWNSVSSFSFSAIKQKIQPNMIQIVNYGSRIKYRLKKSRLSI